MPSYRAIVEGRNFLLEAGGKVKRHGFYQTVFVQSSDPSEAEASAIGAVRGDAELRQRTQNDPGDPPMLFLDALYELDVAEESLEAKGRTYYLEKHWWQFWK